jgi:hypothetical protein
MRFKTLGASLYGIDAYVVEVEVDVDVGSARMQDFNVVGLPDNAVKGKPVNASSRLCPIAATNSLWGRALRLI